MGRGQKIISAVSLVGLGLPGLAGAQKPDSGSYSEAEHEIRVVLGNKVSMRDGVRISVDLPSRR